eukprot:m51a1_g4651 hypothetical protein (336) ;mRNA; r:18779-20054
MPLLRALAMAVAGLALRAATWLFRLALGPPVLRPERVVVRLARLPAALDGLRLALISDTHHSSRRGLLSRTTPQLLDASVAAAESFEPDAIVYTGDFVQGLGASPAASADELCRSWLSRLRAPRGSYAVLGNHDLPARAAVVAALAAAGVRALEDERVALCAGLDVVGLRPENTCDGAHAEAARALLGRGAGAAAACTVVLAHSPDRATAVAAAARGGVDLQLSGHTHGGQVCLPRLGPLLPWVYWAWGLLPFVPMPAFLRKHAKSLSNWQWAQGLHRVPGGQWLYVTRGVGTHPPLRLCCPPEVSLITLRCGSVEDDSAEGVASPGLASPAVCH